MIRESKADDLRGLLELYTQLHDNPMPALDEAITALWAGILRDVNNRIIVAEEDGKIVSSCTLLVVPNLTHGQRPYAVIENVVTDAAYRQRGLATACLDYARTLAVRRRCYKIMLMTGSKQESTLRFYERAGYNRADKTAFIQWLDP